MVVDWRRCRLHDEDLFAPHRYIQLHHYFAVGEPIERTSADLYLQLPSDGGRQVGIGATCENAKCIAQVHLGPSLRVDPDALCVLLRPPLRDCRRPQVPNLLRQHVLNIFNFSFTDAIRYYEKDRSGDLLRVDFIAGELPLNSSEELVPMALLDRFSGWIPPLVVEP